MECGGSKKRNEAYSKNFSEQEYFYNLLNSDKNSKPVIFDVGAHKGESVIFYKNIFPKSVIHSFEPVEENASTIKKLNFCDSYVHNLALSNFNGDSDFYVQDITHLSSLNKVNRDSKDSFEYGKREKHHIRNIKVCRGDDFCSKLKITEIDLLKIDVQANEVNTIVGFKDIIKNVKNIFIEIAFYDFYEKKSSIKDIEINLPNFSLYDIYEVSKNPRTQGTDWANFVYKNNTM